MEKDSWREIRSVSGMPHANLIVGRLEAEGIPALLRYEAAGLIYAITVDGLGEVKILVPEEDWERACTLLEEPFDEGDLHWDRPD